MAWAWVIQFLVYDYVNTKRDQNKNQKQNKNGTQLHWDHSTINNVKDYVNVFCKRNRENTILRTGDGGDRRSVRTTKKLYCTCLYDCIAADRPANATISFSHELNLIAAAKWKYAKETSARARTLAHTPRSNWGISSKVDRKNEMVFFLPSARSTRRTNVYNVHMSERVYLLSAVCAQKHVVVAARCCTLNGDNWDLRRD